MVFGNIMVHTAFKTTLKNETGQFIEEMKIFQYALVASLEGLPKEYQATDMAVTEIVKSIQQSLNNTGDSIIIYNKNNKIIYQNSNYQSKLIESFKDNNYAIWQIHKYKEHYYLESLCEAQSRAGNYKLELHHNIDYVYQDRQQLYNTYFLSLIIVFTVFSVVVFVFSNHFTRPIRKLSHATRSFANGNYKSRVKVKGHNEVAVLSMDFNQMAEQLEQNIIKLEQNARQQEEFTAAFSHELKTPLTSIIGYADMLRSMEMSKEDTFMSANYIFSQGKRLERLSLKLLELLYIDKQEIIFQEINSQIFANQVKIMTEKLLQPKEILLLIEVENGNFYGEPDLLLSLFSNLIDNARKAADTHGKIILEGTKTDCGYCFCLKDNGKGMPQEEIHKITEPFYIIDKSRARKEGGAGIGMTLCRKIIKLHHAEWDIQSTLGNGTQITIYFTNNTDYEGIQNEKI